MKLIDLTGQTFGRLTVIERAPADPRRPYRAWWRCRCVCGVERVALGDYLRDGRTHSCGTACVHAEGRRPWPAYPSILVGADGSLVGPTGRVLAPFLNGGGYPCINTFRDGGWAQHTVHKIVCETYHGPRPEGLIARHLDGDRTNPAASNLRWGTYVENEEDKLLHGRRLQGETHHQRKLTEDDVRAIRASTETARALSQQYPVGAPMIRRIRARRNWSHV